MRSSFLRWAVFAPLLAIMAACGGGGGGGGGGGPVDPRDRPDDGIAAMQITPNPVKLGEKVQIIVNVDCPFTMGPNLELVRPDGSVINVMLFGDIQAPYVSFYEFAPDMAGEWQAQYDGWADCGYDPHVWLHFWVTDGPPPPPPPPPGDCEVGIGADPGQCDFAMWHLDVWVNGRKLDLMTAGSPDRALVRNARMCVGRVIDDPIDIVQLPPDNGFCRCYWPNTDYRWIQVKAEVWCNGAWTEVDSPWNLISVYVP